MSIHSFIHVGNRSGRSPFSDLSESGDTFRCFREYVGHRYIYSLEKRRGVGRLGDTVWILSSCERSIPHMSVTSSEVAFGRHRALGSWSYFACPARAGTREFGGGRILSSSYLYGMALFRLLGVSEAQRAVDRFRSRRCAPGLGGSLLAAMWCGGGADVL